MTRLPGALFVVDIKRENIAVKEAQKLKIPIFAMVDTNSDPREVNYVIPSNDDATKSIDKILSLVIDAIGNGLKERKDEKEAQENEKLEKEKAENEIVVEASSDDKPSDESSTESKGSDETKEK